MLTFFDFNGFLGEWQAEGLRHQPERDADRKSGRTDQLGHSSSDQNSNTFSKIQQCFTIDLSD